MKNTGNLGLKKPEGTDLVDIDDLNYNADIIDTAINNKVDKVTGKQLSTNDYTASEKTKLAGIATGATNYTHPATHPPSIIAQDASNRFVTDAEKTAWNGKAPNTLVSAAPQSDGLMRATDKIKLDGIATGANNYVHPANHPATMITEDATHRFATDTEKSNWNSKPNLATTPQQTTADITYYVRTDGNDSNTGLANTAGGAFKTIGKAISVIPQMLNHAAVINIANGTYAETVSIYGFSGKGSITFNPSTSAINDSLMINNMIVTRCSIPIVVNGIKAISTSTDAFSVWESINVQFLYCKSDSTALNRVGILGNCSKVYIYECILSNKNYGIYGGLNADVFSFSNSGTGNTVATYAAEGGQVSRIGRAPAGTLSTEVGNSGLIVSTGVINPWGDNTKWTRPMGEMHHQNVPTAQTIPAQTWTKVLFTEINNNIKSISNVANSRFVIPEPGFYSVDARVGMFSTSPGLSRELLAIYVDGIYNSTISEQYHAGKSDIIVSGNALLDLYGGQTVELYAYSDVVCSISTADQSTHFAIIRLA
ncbi:hypothetical protein NYE44_25085 [Paenibacillus sp. FSL L8-0493]|uniref:hypothetical protein n=1 Tax=unclassified Paenibacillus TaxID=185978 RepID=UPI00096BD88E|nr:hypothetical protein BJP48_18590 [Paenibacillus odorifer]